MVFNTALCFVLLALAVMLDNPDSQKIIRLQQWMGGIVILIAAVAVGQRLSGVNIGLDSPSLHRWLDDDNRYPGSMSRSAAWAFLFCGATLVLMHRVRGLWSGLLVQALTAMPAALAVMAIAGLVLELRFVYQDFLFGQAALAAASFITISVALWLCWRRKEWYRSRAILKNEGQRIGLTGALILAIVTSSAVLAGFSTAQREVEATISESLLQSLNSNIKTLALIVEHRTVRAQTISSRPMIGEYLLQLKSQHNESEAIGHLSEIVGSFLPLGFSGIAFFDGVGREVLRAGRLADQPQWSTRLELANSPDLLWWNGDLLLRIRLPIFNGGNVVGAVLTEQPLPALANALSNINEFNQTSEIGICKLQDNMFHCLPQRFVPRVYSLHYSKTLPMSRATAGQTGIMRTRDYRQKHVIAAHGPINDLNFGMVVKMDTVELYTPIREQLNIALLLSFVLSVGGGLFGEIERSREIIREQGAQALRGSEARYSGIITSAMDAIIAVDERRCILLFNPAAERMFQYSTAKVIGRPLDMLLPLRFRSAHERHIREFAESSMTARSMNRFGTIYGLRANGEEFPIEASISQIGVSPDKLFTVILRDVTERMQAEHLIAGQNVLLQGIAVGQPLSDTLDAICRFVEIEVQDMLCSVLLLDNDGVHMRHGSAPSLPAEFIRMIDGLVIGPAAGSCGTAAFRREPVIVEDIAIDPLWVDYRELALPHGLRACWSTPILDEQQRVLGTFAMYYGQPRKPAPQQKRLIEIATHISAIAIQRDRIVKDLYELSRRLLEAEEAERRAIARELHDRIGQDLSAINLTMDLMRMQPHDDSRPSLQSRLDDMQKLVRSSIDSTRNIMADLHPAGLDDSGLAVALQYHAERISQRLQIPVTVNNGWSSARPAAAIELALFRIAQEAINNIAKHAAARNIRIDLEEDATTNRRTLRISDDGQGFDTAATRPTNHGLRTMRERAQAVNAALRIDSAPGKGTRISVKLKWGAA